MPKSLSKRRRQQLIKYEIVSYQYSSPTLSHEKNLKSIDSNNLLANDLYLLF